VLYLAAAVAGAARRTRLAVAAVAAFAVVAAPTAILIGVGERTGVVRAQDRTVVQAGADARRLLAGHSPYTAPFATTPRGREAVSESFRLDPPAEHRPEDPLLPPGPGVAVGLGRLAGIEDLRLLGLLALGLLVGLGFLRLEGERTRTAWAAVVLLAAPLSLGTLLGSPAALALAALCASWVAVRSARRAGGTAAGLFAGLAVALDHRAALAAPLLLVGGAVSKAARTRAIVAAAAAYALVVLPVALLDPGAFVERLDLTTSPGPGLGLFNLLAYRGAESSAGSLALAAGAPLLGALVTLALLRGRGTPVARAAVASLAGIVLAPALSADAVAAPIVLLTLAAADAAPGPS
jgi:hypothetical protein